MPQTSQSVIFFHKSATAAGICTFMKAISRSLDKCLEIFMHRRRLNIVIFVCKYVQSFEFRKAFIISASCLKITVTSIQNFNTRIDIYKEQLLTEHRPKCKVIHLLKEANHSFAMNKGHEVYTIKK